MKTFARYAKEWEENAAKDADWSVLSCSDHEDKQWDEGEFYALGRLEISRLCAYIQKVKLPISLSGKALDFGCGTGRCTVALGEHCEQVIGVDLAKGMIEKARERGFAPHIEFVLNRHPHLNRFESKSFDFIYSNIVLQHIAKRHQLLYIAEFARLVETGGWVVMQLPSKRIFSSVYQALRGRIANLFPYRLKRFLLLTLFRCPSKALREFHFEINLCSEKRVLKAAKKGGLALRHRVYTNACDSDFGGAVEFFSKEEALKKGGYLSPLYFFQKERD